MKLPDSWVMVPIATVCDINPRIESEEKPNDDTLVTFVPMSAVDENTATIAQPEIRKYSEVSKGYTYFKPNDVLFAKVTPCMENGKAAIARDLENGLGFGSTEFHVVRPSELILPEYLLYYIRQTLIKDFAKSSFVGTGGLQRVPPDFFRRAKIPLPSIPEQNRIVKVFQQAEGTIKIQKYSYSLTSQILREYFLTLFGHPAENPNDFEVEKFTKLGQIERGVSKHRPRDADHLLGGPYPLIQTGDVANAGDWITEYKNTYSEAGLAQSRLWPKGTLCITIAANIARASILDFEACFPDSVVGFTPHEGIYPEYILYCIGFYQEFFEARAPKSAQMNINLEILKRLRIPKPPSELQKKFSEIVWAIRQIKDSIGDQIEKQNDLNKALQLSAFSGELTENWRKNNEKSIAKAVKARNEILSTTKKRTFRTTIEITTETKQVELSIEEKKTRRARNALLKELSTFQKAIHTALQKLNRMLIPDDPTAMDQFCNELATNNENYLHDRVLRALDQLTALGLIAKVSLPNNEGHYLNGYRILREGETRRMEDIQSVKAALKHLEIQKAAG
jgi:type I restriction enzyme S subunit